MIHDKDKLLLKYYKEEGPVFLGSRLADDLGFTSDKFEGYLWQEGGSIWISFIESIHPGKGNLRKLFDAIEDNGFTLIVPTPFARMKYICEQRGMEMCKVMSSDGLVYAMIHPKTIPQMQKSPTENEHN